MLAVAAAVVFALALILDWANQHIGSLFTVQTLTLIGLILVALHLGGLGGAGARGTGRTTRAGWRRR
jgi:hypothetical protein